MHLLHKQCFNSRSSDALKMMNNVLSARKNSKKLQIHPLDITELQLKISGNSSPLTKQLVVGWINPSTPFNEDIIFTLVLLDA